MSLRLSELLMDIAWVDPRQDRPISGLSIDTQHLRAGEAFVALAGSRRHGVEFAAAAVARGAVAVIAEAPLPEVMAVDVPVIAVPELRTQLGAIAMRIHGDSAQRLRLIGVTGTNGKTSTVQLIAAALAQRSLPCGTIGTLGVGMPGAIEPGERTTPDVLSLHAAINQMARQGAAAVALEVSSHALDQQRVAGLAFETAVFTNLTRDHLDYHGTMDAYGAAKARLFQWPSLRLAIIDVDDAFGAELAERVPPAVRVISTGIDSPDAEVRASEIRTLAQGLVFRLKLGNRAVDVQTRLIGHFNVRNLLAVAAMLHGDGFAAEQVADCLARLEPVPGRMERRGGATGQALVLIDYAHTPDALEKALLAARAHCRGRLLLAFGCGGERDSGKRPHMAAIAERGADLVCITDDNPRGEDGDAIVRDIQAGLVHPDRVRIQRDRRAAIAMLIAEAGPDDVVLIAGKGHEPYQEIRGVKWPFDDREVAAACLAERAA